jgi:5-methylcytosine-specific restriction protein A
VEALGRKLNQELGIGAMHALFSAEGKWYEQLKRFPGVLFDLHGYVVFKSRPSYESCPQLRHGRKLNVKGGISSIRGYVRDERIMTLVRIMQLVR